MKEDAKPKTPRDQGQNAKAAEEADRRTGNAKDQGRGCHLCTSSPETGPLTEQVTQAQNRLDALRETLCGNEEGREAREELRRRSQEAED